MYGILRHPNGYWYAVMNEELLPHAEEEKKPGTHVGESWIEVAGPWADQEDAAQASLLLGKAEVLMRTAPTEESKVEEPRKKRAYHRKPKVEGLDRNDPDPGNGSEPVSEAAGQADESGPAPAEKEPSRPKRRVSVFSVGEDGRETEVLG